MVKILFYENVYKVFRAFIDMEVKKRVMLFGAFLLAFSLVTVSILYAQEAQETRTLLGDAFDDLCLSANRELGCVSVVARDLKPGVASVVEEKTSEGIKVAQEYTLPADGHLRDWGIDCTNVQEAGTIVLSQDGAILFADISVGEDGGTCSFKGSTPRTLPQNSQITYYGGKLTDTYVVKYLKEGCNIFCQLFDSEPSFTPPTNVVVSPQVPITPGSKIPISAHIAGRTKLVEVEVVNSEGEVLKTSSIYDGGNTGDGEKGDEIYAGVIDTSGLPAGDYSTNIVIFSLS